MQRRLALHGMDESDVVHAQSELWKEVAHPAPALSVLAKGPVTSLTVAGLRCDELNFAIGIERLARALRQLRFVIPRIDVAETTGAKDLDHSLRLYGMMRGLRSEWICRGLRVIHHGRECDTAKTAAELLQEIAAGDKALLLMARKGGIRIHELVEVNKLVGIDEHPAEREEPLVGDERRGGL